MNPNTGELVRFLEGQDERLKRIRGATLQREAMRELAGRDRATVDLQARTPLAAWAKKKRKAKISTASRRRNRK